MFLRGCVKITTIYTKYPHGWYNKYMFYEVIPEGRTEALTYDFDNSLLPGQIVLVPVGRRSVPGLIIKKVAQPDFKTKSILKVLYSKPLPRHLIATIKFIHEYYLAPSGAAVSLILPKGVEKKRRKTEQMFGNTQCGDGGLVAACPSDSSSQAALAKSSCPLEHTATKPPSRLKPKPSTTLPDIPLNPAQKKALEGLQKAPGATKLLFGVTGSGKTNIYLRMANTALLEQKSTILLVPEIALTGQLVQVFREFFDGRVVVMHSRQTEAERHLIFNSLLNSKEPLVVIGPRSALFAPLNNLGLIIIDEEHESTYHQENSPKYSAIRVASYITKETNCPLVLGSATPTAEDYYIASKQGSVVTLTEKAKSTAIKPKVQTIDLRDRDAFSRNKYFSNSLLNAIKQNLEQGQQTLIFHNRRGSAPLTICENCGKEFLCPNCFLPLTLHADTYDLVCHTCGYHQRVPANCPECKAPGLVHKGFGTKLLESELGQLFPKARIRRFDADNKKGEGIDAVYDEVKDGKVDILVGTQTVAKGLDLPKLATVGIVQADAGLALPDYMAEERTFQLITQVMGRVGRGHLEQAEVIIQTFRPDHPVLEFAVNEDYLGFYDYLIKQRRKSGFPPFSFVMKLEITMKTESIVLKKVQELILRLSKDKQLIISPPMPAFHERTARGYTWQIIVRSRSRKALLKACEGLDINFKVTLDPLGLL